MNPKTIYGAAAVHSGCSVCARVFFFCFGADTAAHNIIIIFPRRCHRRFSPITHEDRVQTMGLIVCATLKHLNCFFFPNGIRNKPIM